jgi:transcriptional regulator with XRE-family HTH domain
VSAERSMVIATAEVGPRQADFILLGGSRQEMAVARQVRARALVAGAQPADIAAAIASECGSSRIRAYRLALGIALADVVAQVRARFEADGRRVPRFSETLLSAYESGQKRPGPEYLHYLCAVYQADPADLGFDGRCLCGHPHRRAAGVPAQHSGGWGEAQADRPDSASPAHGPVPVLTPVPLPMSREEPGRAEITQPMARVDGDNDDDDELRDMLIRQMAEPGSKVDSRFLGAVDRIRRRMDDALLGGTVSAAMIDRREQATAGYGRLYMTVPPLRLLCDVLLDFADVRRMCEERQPLEFSERLCRLAAQLAGLAGIAMLDLGDHRLARSFFQTARTAADETGDRQLRAWVAVREAMVPLYYGDPGEAAALAGAATDLAGRHLCVAAAMAPVIEARAQARMASLGRHGRRQALCRARASLDRAQDMLGDLAPEQCGDAAFGYTERQLYFHTGDALVSLGDWQGAGMAFGQAAALYSGSEVLDCALVALGQARCLLESDEPEQALVLGRDTVLGLPPEHRTEVIAQVARSVGQEAAARYPSLPALAGYREALQGA